MTAQITWIDLPEADYCRTHDAPFYGAECPACIADHNAEIDSEIANLGTRLAHLLNDRPDYKPTKAETCLIQDILQFETQYKQGV